MITFAAQPYYARFAQALAVAGPKVALGTFQMIRFPDGELRAAIRQGVEDQDCLLVGTVAPPDSQLLETLLLAETLKRNGARSVRAFLPYLAYARQDRFTPGLGGGVAAIGALLKTAGVDTIITIDLHTQLDSKLIGLPVVSLQPSPLFAAEIQRLGWPDITVVAPDQDSIHRNQTLAKALGVRNTVVHLVKKRTSIVHQRMVGSVGLRVVMADDILDGGRTLVSACNVLHQQGVRQIAVAVTHGLFTGSIWKELFSLGVKALLVTDSCPSASKTEQPEVRVVPIQPLLPGVLAAVRKESADEAAA